MISTIIILLMCASALVIRSICVLNQMGPKTPHLFRGLYMLTGSAGFMLMLLLPDLPADFPWFKTWVVAGATILFVTLQPLLGCPTHPHGEPHVHS